MHALIVALLLAGGSGSSVSAGRAESMTWEGRLDFGAIAAGTCADLSFSAVDAVANEAVACGGFGDLYAASGSLLASCAVSAADTVSVRACCTNLLLACANPPQIVFSATSMR